MSKELLKGECIFTLHPWSIFHQDVGMGEREYAVFRNNEFFCQCPDLLTAYEIIGAVRFTANWANAEAHDKNLKDNILKTVFEIVDTIPDFNRMDFKLYVVEALK